MEEYDIYRDIATRCGGTVFIGVVGPVRTGKSTLIAQMMEKLVLPHLPDGYGKERMVDELPQSGSGRTIMTTQPRFVPAEPVSLRMDGVEGFSVRFVDCVGYVVDGAMGAEEEGQQRMVRTPWFDHDIPFEEAAELGTRKVIAEHSTLGVVVTTDGSITEMPRAAYAEAEERVVRELNALGKPFVVVINTSVPNSEETLRLRNALSEKYGVTVTAMDVEHMTIDDLNNLLESLLFEFPLTEIDVVAPRWVDALKPTHWLVAQITDAVRAAAQQMTRVRDHTILANNLMALDDAESAEVEEMRLNEGAMTYRLRLNEALFYRVLGEESGQQIENEEHLFKLMTELVYAKREYDRVAGALASVRSTGYGMVSPLMSELSLEKPEIVRQGNRFGVKLKASAPSLHIMRANIHTELSPTVGSEQQGEELIKSLLADFETDPSKLWSTNIFGKSLNELVSEGVQAKLLHMPQEARSRLQQTLERIINEGTGGLICIIL